jgi:large subunit ribosomal protein L22
MAQAYRSYLKAARVAPRKARLVVNLIRGKHVQDALDTLRFLNKRAAPIVAKMISSAIANAKNTSMVDVDNLVVGKASVDGGPMFKRYIPRAQGRATPVRKKTSHITIELLELQ